MQGIDQNLTSMIQGHSILLYGTKGLYDVSNPCIIGIELVLYVLNSTMRSRDPNLVPNGHLTLSTQISKTQNARHQLCKYDICGGGG